MVSRIRPPRGLVIALRRRLAGLLARWAVRVDPDPPLTFTMGLLRRIDVDYPAPSDITPLSAGCFFAER